MNTCCTLLFKRRVQQVLAVYMRCTSRSITLCRQIGCGYIPLAEEALTVGLISGHIARKGIEQMTIVLDLAPVYILEDTQFPAKVR